MFRAYTPIFRSNNTKDICSICKEIIPLFAPEDGRVGPKHVELNK